MPLVDLRTNLKSFKYGHDRPGGGDSGQPFITTNIDTGATSVSVGPRNILRLFGIREIPGIPNLGVLLNRSRGGRTINEILGGDEFIRGGALGAAQASLNDTFRIGSFFLTLPKGPIFIAQQVGLQLSNPRLERKGGTGIGSIIKTFSSSNSLREFINNGAGLFAPTRTYNAGINTIAQIPVNAFGGHFYRHGILPIQDEDTKYASVVQYNNENGDNRLVKLANKFELGDNEFETTPGLFDLQAAKKSNRQSNKSARKKVRQTNRASKQAAIKARKLEFEAERYMAEFGFQVNPGAILKQPLSDFGFNKLDKPKRNKLNLNGTNNVIDSYLGGPDSVYGIGLTVIKRYEFTEDKTKYDAAIEAAAANAGKGILNGKREEFTYLDPKTSGSILKHTLGKGANSISEHDDVPDDIPTIAQGINVGMFSTYSNLINAIEAQQVLTISSSGNNIAPANRSVANGIGWASTGYNAVKNSAITSSGYSSTDIGKIVYKNTYGETVTINKSSWNAASREVRVGSGRKDSINLTPLFKAETGKDTSVVTIGTDTYTINDLVKFRIEAIDGDTPEKSVFMVFRAYLTDLSDGVDATWNDIKYAGRGERFYIYDGFTRTINVSFKVAALSAGEMEPMYRKLNNLMGNLMPDYTPGNAAANGNVLLGTTSGVMRGPLVRMTIGNWIDSQPGILKSLSYKVPQDSPWEIALNEPIGGGTREMILPHIVEVTLSFVPIGSQTQNLNKTPNKASSYEHTSHLAQNFNGSGSASEPNYINGQEIKNTAFPGGVPSTPY